MITDGMLNEMYSNDLSRLPEHLWREEHHQIIDTVTGRAVAMMREILDVIGDERLQELVTASLEMEHELVGDEAQRFFIERLDPETLRKMREVAERFVADPLGQDTK